MVGLFLNFPRLFDCETNDKKKPIDIAMEYNDLEVIEQFFDLRHIRDAEDRAEVITLEKLDAHSSESNTLPLLKEQYKELVHHDPSALYSACRQLHGHKIVSHLINPNSIMYRDKHTGLTPLMVAVQHRQLQTVKELLNSKNFTQEAFELATNVSFRTVLHICTKVHNKEITKALFDSHYMSNTLLVAADMLGDTPLHSCAQVGNLYMAQRLLSYIIDNNSPVRIFSDSPMPLTTINYDANRRVSPEPFVVKVNKGASHYGSANRYTHTMLIKRNKGKLTPLHVAIQAGNLDIINEMLKYADPSVINMCDDQQSTSLHMAAAKGKNDLYL